MNVLLISEITSWPEAAVEICGTLLLLFLYCGDEIAEFIRSIRK